MLLTVLCSLVDPFDEGMQFVYASQFPRKSIRPSSNADSADSKRADGAADKSAEAAATAKTDSAAADAAVLELNLHRNNYSAHHTDRSAAKPFDHTS